MKKINLLLFLFAFAFAAFSTQAWADDRMTQSCPAMMGQMDKKMDAEDKFYYKAHYLLANAGEIGLSDEQIKSIKQIKLRVKKSAVLKEAEIKTLGLDLLDALDKDTVDMKAIAEIIEKKYDLKKQRTKELIKGYVDLKGALTKDQVQKVKESLKGTGKGRRSMGQGLMRMEEPPEKED
ncbi:MAG: hypothetical protein WC732_01475 [Candidatus Omnitrophota bacterium]